MFDIATSGEGITPARGLDKQEGRILSLTWHPSGEFIAVGGADSTVRKMNVRTGRCVLRITLDEYKPRSTLVWDLKFLSDATLVSADSLGKIQLWNGKHGTLRQSFQLHLADVLTLAVNEEEDTIYASGVDHKLVRLQKVKDKKGTWVKTGEVRQHSHDIRSIALSKTGVIASGGLDTQLILCPAESFEVDSCVRYLPFSNSSKNFAVASEANVLMFQTSMSLKFWQLSSENTVHSTTPPLPNGEPSGGTDLGGKCQSLPSQSDSEAVVSISEKVANEPTVSNVTNGVPVNFLEIKTKAPLHILSSAISPDGSLVVLSNSDQMWLFRIVQSTNSKIKCLRSENLPSYKMAFSPDGSVLVLATINEGVKVAKLNLEDECSLDIHMLGSQKDSIKHPVNDFQLSLCGAHLATRNTRNRICVYNLQSGQLLSRLPRLEGQPLLFSFHPSKPQLVLFSGQDRETFMYDIENEQLSSVGTVSLDRRYDGRTKLANPNGLTPVTDVFALYDNDCIVLLRCNKSRTSSSERAIVRKKKRHRSYDSDALPYQLILSYHLVLFVSPLSGGRLVVVERPWSEVMKKFPPALTRDRYGT